MKRTIIAISRQHGAGGTEIAQLLSARLSIPCYERTVIELAAEKTGFSPSYIEGLEESSSRSFLFNLVSGSYTPASLYPRYDVPVSLPALTAQASVIRELAQKGSCIIVGRCAEYILREDPDVVPVFLRADKADRISFVMKDEGLEDRKAAESRLVKTDRGRMNYYRSYTGEEWGAMENHDLSINTSRTGISGAVDVIVSYLHALGRL